MNNNYFSILDLLRSDGSIVINKALIHGIGLNESILFCELLSRRNYFEARNQLLEGYFYNTQNDLQSGTGLGEKAQRTAINNLKKYNLIDCRLRGIPAKRYFIINDDENIIIKYLKKGKEIAEKLLMKQGLQDTSQGGNLKLPKKYLDTDLGSINNTNINNTNFNKTTTEKNVVVDESFIDNFIKEFKNKYNTTLNKKRFQELFVKSDKETLNYYFTNFNKFLESTEIKNKASYFYKAVIDKYTIPDTNNKPNKKVSQENNYQQRQYPDEYFDSLYENR